MEEKRQYKQTARYYFTREIARGVAKRKMKAKGFVRMCKRERTCLSPKQMREKNHVVIGRSTFANQWRMYAMAH
jgi:hypothetical protein